ncbi:MAG: anthranilate synthase component I family protein [Patescibacteria group bacterium]
MDGVSFSNIWQRLSSDERSLCCTQGYGEERWETSLAWNPVSQFVLAAGEDPDELTKYLNLQQHDERRTFGFLSYDISYALFRITPHAKKDLALPDACFFSFDSYTTFADDGVTLWATDKERLSLFEREVRGILDRSERNVGVYKDETPHELEPNTSAGEYGRSYQKIKDYIFEGDIYQINLTHRLKGITKKFARDLFLDVCAKNQVGFLAYFEGDGFELLSASPEKFIEISVKREIETFPIKGTRPRGRTSEEDEQMRKELLASEKEAAELNMITDLLRNDLGKICKVGSVKVASTRVAHAFATVWHTVSHVHGVLKEDMSSASALLALFPGGSITGCPKKRAMEIIDELEPTRRGPYTGCIGFIDPNGHAEFNIAIRTFIKQGENVFLQVGGGIVADSSEKAEYQETFDKARSFFGIL